MKPISYDNYYWQNDLVRLRAWTGVDKSPKRRVICLTGPIAKDNRTSHTRLPLRMTSRRESSVSS